MSTYDIFPPSLLSIALGLITYKVCTYTVSLGLAAKTSPFYILHTYLIIAFNANTSFKISRSGVCASGILHVN